MWLRSLLAWKIKLDEIIYRDLKLKSLTFGLQRKREADSDSEGGRTAATTPAEEVKKEKKKKKEKKMKVEEAQPEEAEPEEAEVSA